MAESEDDSQIDSDLAQKSSDIDKIAEQQANNYPIHIYRVDNLSQEKTDDIPLSGELADTNAAFAAVYLLSIYRVDNRLEIKLNNTVIYDAYHDYNPALNYQLDITSRLQPGNNSIVVTGWNGPTSRRRNGQVRPNPWLFQWEITRNGLPLIGETAKSQNQQGEENAVVYGPATFNIRREL